jgi:hypothetical protein
MYRVVVHVTAREMPETFEFLEDTQDDAHHFVEEVTRDGFWIDTPLSDTLFPPSAIELVEVLPDHAASVVSDDPVQLPACR